MTHSLLLLVVSTLSLGQAKPPATQPSFLEAKTFLQTNCAYDPRLAIAVDAIVVHQHGAPREHLQAALHSWQEKGYCVGRMFFSDSDATNNYWKGQADGTPHPDDVERDHAGNVVMCGGVRPYMLPTTGWTRHLEDMARLSIDAGAQAILPEEPLAHVFTGYEKAFAPMWRERFGSDWQPENSSPAAHTMTAQLKGELYAQLESRLAALTKERGRELGRDIPFLLPVHSIYSNLVSRLVAPLGTSLQMAGIDGYVGQVWTGPVNWVQANYNSQNKSFFSAAYVLYDYFVALADDTGRRLFLLTDPVEDDPNHKWSEFERWYRESVVAELFFPQATQYEVMPWPDRIFLPGHSTGGSTPAPENFRINVLSATQALQEMPSGGEWTGPDGKKITVTKGIGVAVADTMLWQPNMRKTIQSAMGMMIPLVEAGVPVSACILERAAEPKYLDRFKVIVLSYETCQPPSAETDKALATWVRGGGSLLILGAAEEIDGPFWWNKAGHKAPLEHLLKLLNVDLRSADGEKRIGKGWLCRRTLSPGQFGQPATAQEKYFPLLSDAVKRGGDPKGLQLPGSFRLDRGPFIIARAGTTAVTLPFVLDVFDPDLPVHPVELKPGQSGLYLDITRVIQGKAIDTPKVLHATHRLVSDQFGNGTSRIVIRGPAETPAVARIYHGGWKAGEITARTASGKPLQVDIKADGSKQHWRTLLAKFPNDPAGATLEIHWTRDMGGR